MTELKKQIPKIATMLRPTNDLSRVRLLVLVQNAREELTRVRCCIWNDFSLPQYCDMPPEVGDSLSKDWDKVLKCMINHEDPKEMEAALHPSR